MIGFHPYCPRFSHGPCAGRCRLLRADPLCVPCVMGRGRGPAADHQPAGADQPGGRHPLPGPGGHQLLLHLRPQPEEASALPGGTAAGLALVPGGQLFTSRVVSRVSSCLVESGPEGDQIRHDVPAVDQHPHGGAVLCRSPRIQQTV